ncbi:hypothetical protein ACEYYH_07410 [Microbacterium trichothecenolyticum]|uniref:hypothetical protein n=1 Tax=Microbacterium trichothecenolyticum TaxID=69370 RepID=UPI0035BE9BDA
MNEGLSPREHDEMRDLVLAGTQRVKPVGRHRVPVVAGAIALVMVGAVTGGALTTAALLSSDSTPTPVSTPSVTASTPELTPTPTSPSPAPTPQEPEPAPIPDAVPAFGGDCSATLTDEEVDGLRGVGMMRSDYRWRTGANDVLGGIDCVWVSEEAYLAATVHLFAYPESVVPSAVRDAIAPGCVDSGNGPAVECASSGTVDGTWLLVRAYGPTVQVSASGVDALYAAAAARIGEHPRATPATRTAQWWSQPDCPALAAQIDPGVYGYERVAQLEPTTSDPGARAEAIVSLAGAAFSCELHFTSGSGDTSTGEVVRVDVVPGGALTFPTAVAAEGAAAVTVSGAQAAVIVPGLDRYEGSGEVIVATDGVNTLMVTPDIVRETSEAAPLAEVVFAAMHP